MAAIRRINTLHVLLMTRSHDKSVDTAVAIPCCENTVYVDFNILNY